MTKGISLKTENANYVVLMLNVANVKMLVPVVSVKANTNCSILPQTRKHVVKQTNNAKLVSMDNQQNVILVMMDFI